MILPCIMLIQLLSNLVNCQEKCYLIKTGLENSQKREILEQHNIYRNTVDFQIYQFIHRYMPQI